MFIISRVAEDKAFSDIPGVERIKMEDFKDDPLTADSFPNNCLVLFDDIDTFPDKTIMKQVQALRNDLLEVGRHKMIQVAMTLHNLINGQSTRTPLN